MKKLFFFLTVLFLLTATQVDAATYWVSKAGNDSNGCTDTASPLTTTAKQTIDAGLGCMTGGDTLKIRAGTYSDAIRQSDWPSGSNTTYTVVEAYNGEEVIINHPNFVVYNADSHHLEFRNLIFEGTTVQFDNGTVNIRMSDIEIRNTGGDGLKVGAPVGTTTTNNVFTRVTIHDVATNTVGPPHGLYITSAGNTFDNFLVYNVTNGCGFHLYGGGSNNNNIIKNSMIHNTGGGYLNESGDTESCFYGVLVADGDNNQIFNNLIYHNGNDSVYGNIGQGIVLFANATNTKIYNNTIVDHGTIGLNLEFSNVTGTIAINNIIWNVPTSILSGSNSLTESHNLCVSGCNEANNSKNGQDPLFVDADDRRFPSGRDFNLCIFGPPPQGCRVRSPAADAGINLSGPGFTTDINNAPRVGRWSAAQFFGDRWDIGAYETSQITVGKAPLKVKLAAVGFLLLVFSLAGWAYRRKFIKS